MYTRYTVTVLIRWTTLLMLAAFAGCGGNDGGGVNSGMSSSNGGMTTYAVGGSVTGLASGGTLVLQNNGGDNLNVSANGAFTFATRLASGAAYSVSVLTQPPAQSCAVTNGSGTVVSAGVATVQVTCTATALYTISGAIGPASRGAGTVVTLGGGATATTTADAAGNYSFTGLSKGAYTVTPNSPETTFTPTSAAVTIIAGNVGLVNFTALSNVIFFDDFTGTSLSSAWTIISRHGEYAQGETECNIPQQVSVANGLLTITTAVGPYVCGDFNVDGTVRHAPSSWPYITGDIQWLSFNFTYGTVTVRAKFPPQSTGLWPAIWLLGSNCQNTNPFTADVGYDTCPDVGSSSYAEIDMVECDTNNWCQLALPSNGGWGICGYPVDTQFHVFTLSWTQNAVAVYVDGRPTGCSYSSSERTLPSTPMFLIIQTQTGGVGGAPNDALLPASLQVDFVKVTQP